MLLKMMIIKKANTACFELAEEDIIKENKNEKTHTTESEKVKVVIKMRMCIIIVLNKYK